MGLQSGTTVAASGRRPTLRHSHTRARFSARAPPDMIENPTPHGSLSVVVPTYNEEGNIEAVYERLAKVLDSTNLSWELIFSIDPSTDRTEELALKLHYQDPRVKMLRFSRRFGQPMATIAGMEAASGDAVVVIDCDLQDPPELIPDLIAKWRGRLRCRLRTTSQPVR